MKLSTFKYHVVEKGTCNYTNYYGYKTKKEASRIANEFSKATGKEYEIVTSGN